MCVNNNEGKSPTVPIEMELGYDGNIIGEAPLTITFTHSYKCMAHAITENLYDEADLEDKERGLYTGDVMFYSEYSILLR